MKKIELTPNTLGTIMNLLQQATAGQFLWGRQYDQKPLEIKKMHSEHKHAMAKITIHQYFFKDKAKRIKHETCLLHIFVNAGCQMYYTYGDVFYFKGKRIIIDRKGRYDINSATCKHYRHVERLTVTKFAKNLSVDDQLDAEMTRCKAQRDADQYNRQYWENYEKEMVEDLEKGFAHIDNDDFFDEQWN